MSKKASKTSSDSSNTTTPAAKAGVISFTVNASDLKDEKVQDADGHRATIQDPKAFLKMLVASEPALAGFFKEDVAKRYMADSVGAKILLKAFKSEDVLEKCGWETVKKYFMDHMNANDVFAHIGYDAAKAHFQDKIDVDANSSGQKKETKKKGLLDEV